MFYGNCWVPPYEELSRLSRKGEGYDLQSHHKAHGSHGNGVSVVSEVEVHLHKKTSGSARRKS